MLFSSWKSTQSSGSRYGSTDNSFSANLKSKLDGQLKLKIPNVILNSHVVLFHSYIKCEFKVV